MNPMFFLPLFSAAMNAIKPKQQTPSLMTQAFGPDIITEQKPTDFSTAIPPEKQAAYQAWKQNYAPNDSGYDYDLPGAFLAGEKPDPITGHMTDLFKKPNHPTFSVESKYAKQAPYLAGSWNQEEYMPNQYQTALVQMLGRNR